MHSTAQHSTAQHRHLFMMFLFLCSLLHSGQGYAQFMNTFYPQVAYPNPVSSGDYLNTTRTTYISNFSTETGNPSSADGLDVIGWSYNNGSAPFGGMIAAGTHPFGLSTSFAGEATLPIPNAVDIRVAYMAPYIVVAYWETTTSQYIMEWYSYIPGSGFISPVPSGSLALPTFPVTPPATYERISMDINDDATEGAIVYSIDGVVYGYAFTLSGGTIVPYFTIPYPLSTGGGNTQPDIVFGRDLSINDYVYITYHNGGTNFTGVLAYPVFTSGTTILTATDVKLMPTGVTRVNMDTPPASGYPQWAYTYSDGNNIYLRYRDASTPLPAQDLIVNDGTLGGLPTDITPYNNIAPVVSYTHNNDIQVAWASDAMNAYNPVFTNYTQSYIGTNVDVNNLGGPQTISGVDYLLIDDDPNRTYVSARPLIALNRHGMTGNRFISFGIDGPLFGYELFHKNIEEFQPTYLTGIGEIAKNSYIKCYPNPFANTLTLELPKDLKSEVWHIKVSDLLGRSIAQYSGKEASEFLAQSSASWKTGQYIIKLESVQTEPQVLKVTKQ